MLVGDIDVEVVHSRRKTMALQVKADGRVVARVPMRMGEAKVKAFVEQHRAWVEKKLAETAGRAAELKTADRLSETDIRELAEKARADLPARAARLAPQVGVTYGRVTIRLQKTRWGSCSSKGNLNFNCLLMLAPEQVRDYVVAHELCHRKEMNHSPRFWAEVGRVLPDYQASKKWLKDNGKHLMARAGL